MRFLYNIEGINRFVKNIIKDSTVNFTIADIEDWYNKLKMHTNVSEQVKAEHVSDVIRYKG
jgi:hypothetical protein